MPTIGTQLNVMIDPDKRDKFKNKVRGEGKTINEVVNELIDSYLANANLSNQPNPDELEEAIANSKKFQELESKLETIESLLVSNQLKTFRSGISNESDPNTARNFSGENEPLLDEIPTPKLGTPEIGCRNDEETSDNHDEIPRPFSKGSRKTSVESNTQVEEINDGSTNESDTPSNIPSGNEVSVRKMDEDKGLSDGELAKKLKVHETTATRWRLGKSKPSGKNRNLFDQWEVRGDRWFPIEIP